MITCSSSFQTQFSCSSVQLCNRTTLDPLIESPTHQLHDLKYSPSDDGISLPEVEKLTIYYNKCSPIRIDRNCVERVPPVYGSESCLETQYGPDTELSRNVGHHLYSGSGNVAPDSPAWTTSLSAGSLIKEQKDGSDEELEIKLKSITSFTTEDVEFSQSRVFRYSV